MPTPKGYQKLNLNVPEDLFREFKATTAARGEKMTEVVLTFIMDYVKKYSPLRPGRRSRET